MRALLIIITIFFGLAQINAQVPSPAPAQQRPVYLVGGTAHTATGEVIENSLIAIEEGKITMIGDMSTITVDMSNGEALDITGKHVYPGLIAPTTNLGLVEIDAVRPTRDVHEVGAFNPNARSIIAYNTDSRIIPTVRSNGVLLAQVMPEGGRIAGQSSVVQLDAWNWEDAVVKADDGIHINWPQRFTRKGWWAAMGSIEPNEKYAEGVDELKKFFEEAKAYAALAGPEDKNLKFESMKGLFDGTKKAYIHANYARDILAAIDFIREFKLDGVIVGARDSYLVTEALKANDIPVILRSIHSLPGREEDDIDQPYKTPAILHEAGVLYCLSMDGSWNIRNLPFLAGTAAANGLSKEEALQAITSNAAKILGIDEQLGTLEQSRDATLIVTEGDIFDMRSSNVIHAFINGRQIDLHNKQKMLYDKFREKYE